MKGELHYKDIHARVWVITSGGEFNTWRGETVDRGHTESYVYEYEDIENVIGSIDEEPYDIYKSQDPLPPVPWDKLTNLGNATAADILAESAGFDSESNIEKGTE